MGYDTVWGPSSMSSGSALAVDANALGKLKMQAGSQSADSIKETAKQFESLFMRELLKSMREATMKSGMLDNAGTDLGTDLLDQQFAVAMSGQPGGLSDLIAQQLTRQMATTAADKANTATAETPSTVSLGKRSASAAAPTGTAPKLSKGPTESQTSFVRQHNQAASEAERATGIPASFMLGQAGHETGWGKREIKSADGTNSFNLFGIKAGGSWKGKVAEVTTTEYVDGVAKKQVAKFRAYDSYADAFKDYARLMSDSPRYAKAMQATSSPQAFASGLQRAGYATDPEYASKLSRAINTTLQLRRVQV
ncbi:MAG: flagellar assembly peptidoglycan hydrolase FlgJ [Burkholderiales bacterium PBB4]|nr:MAG: flagellar assembly peptidoglycan hydrolase FlgJ [Burkholderiales bacterium PBB4]